MVFTEAFSDSGAEDFLRSALLFLAANCLSASTAASFLRSLVDTTLGF